MFEDLLEKVKDNYYLVGAIVLALAVVGYFLYQRFYATPAMPMGPMNSQAGSHPGSGREEDTPQLDTNALVGVHVDEAVPQLQEAGLEPEVVPEGSPVTKDFVANRVRLFVDEEGVISSAMQG